MNTPHIPQRPTGWNEPMDRDALAATIKAVVDAWAAQDAQRLVIRQPSPEPAAGRRLRPPALTPAPVTSASKP